MSIKNKLKQIEGGQWFLITVLIVYLFILIININLFNSITDFFFKILIKIIPIFILVFILMAITNYFVTPKFISKHIKEGKRWKKWFFAIVGGILSAGPIYMWYPLLADLKEKGLNQGLIACFLYNRSIKLPLLPLAIFYFGGKMIIILSLVMIFASIIQGIIINRIMK